ncbi:MAG: tRNA (adenosine(37)-N6)-threonylcarbamoyltransferase complex dimerization subunit type 1 TsaB, partial [Deltaproteobacteria bacterium]|nr:tRNA (adenosine(37)-N6)-threonylcarbamoyltransferase complex dimerization subunit type 1 TsaB [Deltaproteobacteria bacterium]
MLVLAWDTSTNVTSLGLVRADGLGGVEAVDIRPVDAKGGHSTTLPPAVEDILKDHALSPTDLDLLAVGRGPGSFTGLRTGLALAKGLAMGAGLPVLGLSTLAVLAGAVNGIKKSGGEALGTTLVAPLVDARHQELFTALYRLKDDSPIPEPLSEILVIKPELVRETLRTLVPGGEAIYLCGSALGLLQPEENDSREDFILGAGHPPEPMVLAAQASFCLTHKAELNCPVTPLYGRSPDIFKKWVPP